MARSADELNKEAPEGGNKFSDVEALGEAGTDTLAVDAPPAEGETAIEGEATTPPAEETADITAVGTAITKQANRNVMLIVGLLVLCGLAIFFFLSGGDDEEKVDKKLPFEEKPTKATEIPVPILPKASTAPSKAQAIAPEPKQSAPYPTPLKLRTAEEELEDIELDRELDEKTLREKKAALEAAKRAKEQREQNKLKSSIMLQQGSGITHSGQQKKDEENEASIYGAFKPETTKAQSTKLSKVGDMSTLITQGKILDAVLETPINTLYSGPIRALISRDVFSEKGENVLIPRGSRVIGKLHGGYSPGKTRVAVEWNRVILPNGYDINIEKAPGVSPLGQIGIEGYIDRQFLETIGSTVLLSILNISTAKLVEELFNIKSSSGASSVSPTTGRQTNVYNESPMQSTAKSEFQNLSNITKDWLSKNFVPQPYIVVDQGTRVKIFVNQDIRFPKNVTPQSSFVK